jgi:hypothetical protein
MIYTTLLSSTQNQFTAQNVCTKPRVLTAVYEAIVFNKPKETALMRKVFIPT